MGEFYFRDGKVSSKASYARLRHILKLVYNRSGVAGAKNHRFRHTFISEGLAAGMTEREMADIVGVSEGVLRRHYSKFMAERQDRITAAVRRLHAFAEGRKGYHV